jgi:hypothetical protein
VEFLLAFGRVETIRMAVDLLALDSSSARGFLLMALMASLIILLVRGTLHELGQVNQVEDLWA